MAGLMFSADKNMEKTQFNEQTWEQVAPKSHISVCPHLMGLRYLVVLEEQLVWSLSQFFQAALCKKIIDFAWRTN